MGGAAGEAPDVEREKKREGRMREETPRNPRLADRSAECLKNQEGLLPLLLSSLRSRNADSNTHVSANDKKKPKHLFILEYK